MARGGAYPAVKTGFTLLAIAQDDVATQLVFAGYRFVGACWVFAGVVLVNLGGNAAGVGFEFSLPGEGFVVISALALLVASMYGKRVSQGMDAMVMTGYQLAFGGATLLYLATLSAVSFGLWGVLLKFNRVCQVSVYMFLTPVFGAGLSALFLGESIWAWENLGALALVSWGIWWVTQEPRVMRER